MEIEQQENKGYNNCGKSSYIINNPNYKWIELTNQKAQSRGMDYTTRPNYVLPAGDSAQLQRQTQAQSEGEDDTSNKWHPERSGCSCTYMRQNRC